MHARILRIPDYLISLGLIALFAAALVAGQARANLHLDARATAAFQSGVVEQDGRDLSTAERCRTHRGRHDAHPVEFSNGVADHAFADNSSVYRYSTSSGARRLQQPANALC